MSISATTGYPILKRHRPPPFMLTRVCASCKHFWGPNKKGAGECRKLTAITYGADSARDCEHWTRRMAGVDPVPFGVAPKIVVEQQPVMPAAPVKATVKADPPPRAPMAPAPPKRSAADARRDQVAALARSGMAGPAIAAALGLSIRTVWSDAAARRVSLGGSGGPSRRAEVYALAEKGKIGAQIARETGMTPSSVSKYLAQWRAGK